MVKILHHPLLHSVRRVEEAGTTRGGVVIPDSAKDKPQEGEFIPGWEGAGPWLLDDVLNLIAGLGAERTFRVAVLIFSLLPSWAK